jgi:eukaryotic-like serine/threonine-protein kinase
LELEPGVVVAQRYKILRPLGRGGMGEVFAAENVRTGRVVAVKVLRADSKQKSSAVARFQREARAAGAINSDHVTQVLDVQDDPEQGIVIVFELLEGESLIDRLKRSGPMSFDEIFPIVEQVWMGLDAAHAAGVIHRDLKPSNVFLERRPDGQTRVKILDFGISKLPKEVGGDTLTEMGQSLGTFSFMPPEQIGKAKTVDHRADIYASATLIYQAMSGQLPYAAKNILQMVDLKTKAEPRSLSSVLDSPADPRLEAFLAKGLARDPNHRFQSATEALEAWRVLKAPAASSQSSPNFQAVGRSPATVMMVDPRSYAAPQSAQPPQPRPGFSAPVLADPASQVAPAPGRPLGGTIALNQPLLPQSINVPVVHDTTSEGAGDQVATVAIPIRDVAQAVQQAIHRRPSNPQVPSVSAGVPRLNDDPSSQSSVAGTAIMSHAALRSAGVPLPLPPTRQPYSDPRASFGSAGPTSAPTSSGRSAESAPAPTGEGADLTTVYRRDQKAAPLQQAPAAPAAQPAPSGTSRLAMLLGVFVFALVGFAVAAVAISKLQTGAFPWE